MSSADLTPRRVIIRTHSDILQEVNQITNAWFYICGYCEENEVYLWQQQDPRMKARQPWGGAPTPRLASDATPTSIPKTSASR
jgi:hypothetical protein